METQLPLQRGAEPPPNFRPISIVAKRSPISATAELLFVNLNNYNGMPAYICRRFISTAAFLVLLNLLSRPTIYFSAFLNIIGLSRRASCNYFKYRCSAPLYGCVGVRQQMPVARWRCQADRSLVIIFRSVLSVVERHRRDPLTRRHLPSSSSCLLLLLLRLLQSSPTPFLSLRAQREQPSFACNDARNTDRPIDKCSQPHFGRVSRCFSYVDCLERRS